MYLEDQERNKMDDDNYSIDVEEDKTSYTITKESIKKVTSIIFNTVDRNTTIKEQALHSEVTRYPKQEGSGFATEKIDQYGAGYSVKNIISVTNDSIKNAPQKKENLEEEGEAR
jgi:hypothetical protein